MTYEKTKIIIRFIERNKELLIEIKKVKTDHPLWGYRRIWSYLKYRQGIQVNKKRIYRLMKERNLMVTPDIWLKPKRGPLSIIYCSTVLFLYYRFQEYRYFSKHTRQIKKP